ncbi:MAG: hypothetical protein P0Y60_04325 [Candidatus Microbacterium colombiense]|nr:MAG: hypothetical protein P0Y60_04325 [Microbacterium sp.]
MSESESAPRTRRTWIWIWVAVAVVAVGVAVGVWAYTASQQASAPTSGATDTPTPQPTEVETPTPGATAPVEKPEDGADVPFGESAELEQGSSISLVSVEGVTAGRDIPGESSGPAVKVVIRVTNNGDAAIDTAGASVNLTYDGDDRTPAAAVSADDATVLPASIAPGASADGVFYFAVPVASDGDIRIMVDILAAESDVVFVGARP